MAEQVLGPGEDPEDFEEHRRQTRKLADEDLDLRAACRAVLGKAEAWRVNTL